VAHSYHSPGDYPVTLAISNDFGVALDTLTLSVLPYTIYMPLVFDGDTAAAQSETEREPEGAPAPESESEQETPIPDAEGEEELAAEPEPAQEGDTVPAGSLSEQMLQAINAEREAVGLPPLTWSDQLARSAQHHSEDMAAYGFTGHYGSNGSRPADRLTQASYPGEYAGECTAWGFDDIASAVAWWMTSPPHRTIVLSTVATEIGGGYGYNPGAPSVHYWTIDFGAR
jgi:uncharacterized protein YkwD